MVSPVTAEETLGWMGQCQQALLIGRNENPAYNPQISYSRMAHWILRIALLVAANGVYKTSEHAKIYWILENDNYAASVRKVGAHKCGIPSQKELMMDMNSHLLPITATYCRTYKTWCCLHEITYQIRCVGSFLVKWSNFIIESMFSV